MGYYIDLEKISIDEYRAKLETAYLPPSRMILKENREERFGYFKSAGINNADQLLQTLKKKDKFAELQKVKCLSGDYLVILLRELKSLLPKPVSFKDFPGITADTLSKLEKAGIKTTVKLFDKVISPAQRKEFAALSGISGAVVLELTKLSDLSRIRWVGPTFARMLYDLGVDTVEKVAAADPTDLHEKVNRLNKEQSIYKGQIGLNDMKILVDTAGELPGDVGW